MKRTIFTLSICALFAFSPAAATRYHVNIHNGDDANDGLKWSTAFKNLQAALNLINDDDEIWIAAGTYHPTKKIAEVYGTPNHVTRPTGDRHRSFIINKNVAIYGGFSANPSDATSVNNRNWQVNQTILSGDFDNNDGDNFENMDENAFHVVILFDASQALSLNGLYITGGCADDMANTYTGDDQYYYVTGRDGGGIYAYSPNNNSSPTLTDVSFYGNYATSSGGGMWNYALAQTASPQMRNVSFVHNKASNGHGGGLHNEGGGGVFCQLTNINVVGNESFWSGGGLYFTSIENCSPTIINTVVSGNYAGFGNGAGIYISTLNDDAEPVIINTTICGNRTEKSDYKDGGGLVIWPVGISKATISNTVIWGNKANEIDNFFADGDWGSANVITGNLIEGFDNLGATNLPGDTDPKFLQPVHADFAPTMEGDYQLTLESPLINKGINGLISVLTDLLGNARVFGGIVDIGAYESQGKTPTFNETAFSEKTVWGSNGNLFVRINQSTTLSVYTTDGSLVKQINNLGEGTYSFALPQGIFFVKLSNGITEKVIIN